MTRIEDDIKQTKPFQNEYHKATVNLIFTGKWVINIHTELFQLYHVSFQQYNILRILKGSRPNVVSLNYIKSRMLDKMSDASRVVETLHRKSYVTREHNTSDRRKVDITISQTGLTILSEIEKKHYILDEALSNLDEKEIHQLNLLLDKARK